MSSASKNSAAREAILRRVRAALPQSTPLPELPASGPWQTFEDPTTRFREVLESVGGLMVRVPDVGAADAWLRDFEPWKKSATRLTVIPGLGDSTLDLNSIDDPHALEHVGFAVLKGHFGVAENAAVWVTDADVRHRVLYFIPQHMALAIPASQIVNNMHEAYGRIQVGGYPFSGFISGPSKTADIEQSLVIGAHGARSLVVFLIEEW
ncbi:MAG: LUD domain-containing protein [Planctomyces sp.]|nr:LUD domain-containing protein [Planctomyces sp.]